MEKRKINKSLMIDEKNWKKLQIMKLKYGFVSINDLITKILSIIDKFKPEIEAK